jgi:DNA-binding SARP family transcriptional activator
LRRRPVGRRHVAATLWPMGSEERSAGNLRSALWRLREADIDVLAAEKTSLRLRDGVTTDLELVSDWASRLITGATLPKDLAVLPTWSDALDLLPGWYEEWALMERERLRQRVLHALEALSHRMLLVGRCAEAVEVAMTAVAVEPLRESAQRALLTAHLAEGNRMESLRSFEAYRRLLFRELGVAPSPELAALAFAGSPRRPAPIEVASSRYPALTG